jgi:hypothetical protein
LKLALLEQHAHGLTWMVDEPMSRASHALAEGGRVWLIDPTEVPQPLEGAAALGRPVAVLQLLDRHNRDCAVVAARLGIDHVRLPGTLHDTPFTMIPLVNNRFWREVALWWAEARVLAVPEAIGTAPSYAPGPSGAGVHIGLRLRLPLQLGGYAPEDLLVGHGRPLHGEQAAAGLHEALARSRRDLPRGVVAVSKMLLQQR